MNVSEHVSAHGSVHPNIWSTMIYYWYLVNVPLSVLFNLVIVVVLVRFVDLLPQTTRLLMLHQSLLDAVSSVLSFLVFRGFDSVQYSVDGLGLWLCLNLNLMYWAVDATAQFNSTVVTFERYFAVCFPMRRVLTVRRLLVVLASIHVAGWVLQVYGLYQTYAVAPDGLCTYVDSATVHVAIRIQGALVVALVDLAPLLALAVLYPQMIAVLTRPSAFAQASESSVKGAATRRLTRTLFIASAISVLANLPDAIIYGWLHAILLIFTFGYNSWQIIVISFFKSLYPLCNPIIYSFSTQRFRIAIRRVFSTDCSSRL